ncbi:MAG: biotin carboxylase N-terminal domain-containing protein, partial [Spirochaetota bacterium]
MPVKTRRGMGTMSGIVQRVNETIEKLKLLNSEIGSENVIQSDRKHRLKKVLISNRGEIAKRFFLSLHEEKIPSVAVVTDVDRGQSWYEFADEVVFIGEETNYTSIPTIIAAAALVGANAIYAGYGFLSENADFVESIENYSAESASELIFMGPTSKTMRLMGDKVESRLLAKRLGVPLFESTSSFESPDIEPIRKQIADFGYPVIVKLSSGGGGKGMYPVFKEEELADAVASCIRIGKELYNDSRFYIEQFIVDPVHIEVQVFNDRAVGIRKCAVQRRNQKIIEESGHTFLPDHQALSFLS